MGLITFSPSNFYAEIEDRQFVTLINNVQTINYDQFSQLQRQRLNEKASFETLLTYQAVLFLESEDNTTVAHYNFALYDIASTGPKGSPHFPTLRHPCYQRRQPGLKAKQGSWVRV